MLPRLGPARGFGGNLAAFFGGLYLVRGLGVLATFLAAAGLSAVSTVLFSVFVTVFLLPVAAFVALTLGVTDTWVDWRRRKAKTT